MQDSVKKYIARLTRDKRSRRRLGSIIGMLSLVVAIGVFWQFKITGITMSDGQTPNDADPTADIETTEVWEATLPALTGVWSEDVAAMAESQLGYAESEANYQLDDDGEPVGYTRYGAWADQQYQPWDAAFASFCLHYAGVSDSLLPVSTVSAADWKNVVSGSEVYKTGNYEAQRGDVVFVDGTVGIVIGAEGSSLTVIVGDSGNAVAQQSYSASSVSGYASVKAAFDIETGVSEEEEPSEEPDAEGATDEEETPAAEEDPEETEDEPEEEPTVEEEPKETSAKISGNVSEKAERKHADTFGANLATSGKNDWQIVYGGYKGNTSSYKTTSSDGNVRIQKNVVPTDKENEFLVYISMDTKTTTTVTRTSFDRFISGATYIAGTASHFPDGVTKGSVGSLQGTEKGTNGNKPYTITLRYQGKVIGSAVVNMEISNGCLYLKLDPSKGPNDKVYIALAELKKEQTVDTELTTESYNKLVETVTNETAEITTVTNLSVTDTMGDYITYDGVVNGDGSVKQTGNTIQWIPTLKSNPQKQTTSSGGTTTTWNLNIAELVYKVHLDVTKAGFNSCVNNMDSTTTEKESYKVNNSATVSYKYDSSNYSAAFQQPYVRGMLYDVLLNKVSDLTSKTTLPGAKFKLTSTDGYTAELTSGADGTLSFTGLQCGTYTLEEVSAPSGYAKGDTSSWTFDLCYTTDQLLQYLKVNDDHLRTTKFDDESGKWYIVNTPDAKKLRIKKTDQSGTALPGATFTLAGEETNLTLTSGDEGYLMNDSDSVLSLSSGTYTLTETDTPDGYNQLTDSITITVTTDGITATYAGKTGKVQIASDEPGDDGIYDMTVTNDAGLVLPMTGGSGTLPYMLAGMLLMLPLAYKITKRCRGERRFD